jgi:two-component system OmpR family response regulator/two-component system response regulator QseB
VRILLVEDDPLLGDALRAGLAQAGFEVDWVTDGPKALAALRDGEHAAAVLDLGLPRLSGFQVLERARAAGACAPVLILTARDAVDDRVRGLDLGADDYVIKPVAIAEIAARLRALVRRSRGESSPTVEVGELALDPAARTLRHRGEAIELKPREFDLLHELMLNAGRVLSRESIESRLYPWGAEVGSNAVEVHVHRLRRKLPPGLIRTVRGVGYMVPRDGARS